MLKKASFSFLARTTCLPHWLYVLLALISFCLFLKNLLKQIISVSTGPIFTMWSVFNRRLLIQSSFSGAKLA